MDREESLSILNKCLNQLRSMPKKEFDRIIVEKRIDRTDYNKGDGYSDTDFKILF